MSAHPHDLTRAQAAALLEERDTLLETVRQLREVLVPPAELPRGWSLRIVEERLLLALRAVGTGVLTRERAIAAVYADGAEDVTVRTLDFVVCHLRRKLRDAGAGIRIETIRHRGFYLDAASLARLNAAIAADRLEQAA